MAQHIVSDSIEMWQAADSGLLMATPEVLRNLAQLIRHV